MSDNRMSDNRRYTALAGLLIASAALTGCGSSSDESVKQARERLRIASADEVLRERADAPLRDAEQMLERADEADEAPVSRHFAYMTERKLDFAEAVVARQQAEQELVALQQRLDVARSALPPPGSRFVPPRGTSSPGDSAPDIGRDATREAPQVAMRETGDAERKVQVIGRPMKESASRYPLPPADSVVGEDAAEDRLVRDMDRERLEMAIRVAREAEARSKELEKSLKKLESRKPPTTVDDASADHARRRERERFETAVRVAREAQARAKEIEKSVEKLKSQELAASRKPAASKEELASTERALKRHRAQSDRAIRMARAAQARAREIEMSVESLRSRQFPLPNVQTVPVVNFDTGTAELSPGTRRRLDLLAVRLRDDEAIDVIVEGYSAKTTGQENMEISLERAAAVKSYLVENGIAAERIQTLGLGNRYPVASNETEEGRAQNRRAEIVLDRARQEEKSTTDRH